MRRFMSLLAGIFFLATVAFIAWNVSIGHSLNTGSVWVALASLESINLFQAGVERYVGQWLWSPILWTLEQPAWGVAMFLTLFMLAFRPSKPTLRVIAPTHLQGFADEDAKPDAPKADPKPKAEAKPKADPKPKAEAKPKADPSPPKTDPKTDPKT